MATTRASKVSHETRQTTQAWIGNNRRYLFVRHCVDFVSLFRCGSCCRYVQPGQAACGSNKQRRKYNPCLLCLVDSGGYKRHSYCHLCLVDLFGGWIYFASLARSQSTKASINFKFGCEPTCPMKLTKRRWLGLILIGLSLVGLGVLLAPKSPFVEWETPNKNTAVYEVDSVNVTDNSGKLDAYPVVVEEAHYFYFPSLVCFVSGLFLFCWPERKPLKPVPTSN